MQLPGRLSSSTLGDLLGSLHRSAIDGIVELADLAGRAHRVHLRAGLVVAVETPHAAGDLRDRLESLFRLSDARIAFRTARPLPPSMRANALGPAEFLHGRPRTRDRGRPGAAKPPPPSVTTSATDEARKLLGLPKDAALGDVRRAFRRLAASLHPDRFASGTSAEREQQAARFAELSAAYHLLVA